MEVFVGKGFVNDFNVKAVEGELQILAKAVVVLPAAVLSAAHLNDRAPIGKVQRLNETGPVEANEDVSGLHLIHLLDVGQLRKVQHIQLKMRDLL